MRSLANVDQFDATSDVALAVFKITGYHSPTPRGDLRAASGASPCDGAIHRQASTQTLNCDLSKTTSPRLPHAARVLVN
jgi:hypothetical protein